MDTKQSRRILVKFGGNALSRPGDMEGFARDLAELIGRGFQPVLVHGGGPEISREMERRGLPVRKAAGLRVTDDAALAVANEVLATINAGVVSSLAAVGINARGTAAADAGVMCERKPPVRVRENGSEVEVDLGNVGDVTHVHEAKLHLMLGRGEVPVIYPIGGDPSGKRYNVNADTVAAFVARAVGAEEMVLLTDVPGLLQGGEGTAEVIHDVTLARIDELIAGGVITGGMIPKVDACRDVLLNGIAVVYMLNGREPRAIVRKLVAAEPIGTTIMRG